MPTPPPLSPLPPFARGWLADEGLEPAAVAALTGDVSLRRYFRLQLAGGSTVILAHYPPDLRPVCRRFVNTTSLLGKAGVPVPRLLATRCMHGLSVVEDAGDVTLYALEGRPWDELLPYYKSACSFIPRIASVSAEVVGALNPRLDASLLSWELDKTWKVFLEPAGFAPGRLGTALREALGSLCRRLGEAPTVPCHRDYMPRNLMVVGPRETGRLLVLDHQDLRLGPPGYDLASLLNDSLFPPPEVEDELVAECLPGPEGRASYASAVVQRTLKAIGNYCEFATRGFDRHLRLVAPTLRRTLRHLSAVPELTPLSAELTALWEERLAEPALLDWLAAPGGPVLRQED